MYLFILMSDPVHRVQAAQEVQADSSSVSLWSKFESPLPKITLCAVSAYKEPTCEQTHDL